MHTVSQWFQNNLDIVFFIYGLAFVSMGIAISVQPRKNSEFKVAKILWLLAGFGLIHGLNEWLDMWEIVKGNEFFLESIHYFILFSSYFFLLEFGIKIFKLVVDKRAIKFPSILRSSYRWIYLILPLFIFIPSIFSNNFLSTAKILTRYFLAFPGGLMTGFAFLLYYQAEQETLAKLDVKRYFFAAGFAFLSYAVLSGLVVQKGNFFPANILNSNSFIDLIGIPVQLFRAVCAIIIAWAAIGMLKIFNWETNEKLRNSLEVLKGLQEQMIRAEKMSSLGILSKGIAHEINNPLAAVLGYSQLLLRDGDSSSHCHKELKEIELAALRCKRIIGQLLAFSQQENVGLCPVDLQLVLDNTFNLLECQIKLNNIKIIRNWPDNIPAVLGSQEQLQQVFVNLTLNAQDAMSNGGVLTISVKAVSSAEVEISVTDTGTGIPRELMLKIFDPFYTTKPADKGTGLGLSVCLGIIERHQGKITVESKLGEGTTFRVLLPIVKQNV